MSTVATVSELRRVDYYIRLVKKVVFFLVRSDLRAN